MPYWDWRPTLVSMTGAPLVVYPLVRLGQRVRRSTRRSQEQLEHLSHLTAEAFTGHRIVKAFGAERHEADRFNVASNKLYRTNLKVTSTVSVLPPMMEFLGGVAVVGLLWYGRSHIASKEITQGEFLAFIFAAFMLYTPIKRLSRVNANIQQSMAAASRIRGPRHPFRVRERPARRDRAEARDRVWDVSLYDDGAGKTVPRTCPSARA